MSAVILHVHSHVLIKNIHIYKQLPLGSQLYKDDRAFRLNETSILQCGHTKQTLRPFPEIQCGTRMLHVTASTAAVLIQLYGYIVIENTHFFRYTTYCCTMKSIRTDHAQADLEFFKGGVAAFHYHFCPPFGPERGLQP